MIQDRLVVGIPDHHLSEWLHLDTELTLEKLRKRQYEVVHIYSKNPSSNLNHSKASRQDINPRKSTTIPMPNFIHTVVKNHIIMTNAQLKEMSPTADARRKETTVLAA